MPAETPPGEPVTPTIVIAAHNEQNVLGATLDALLAQSEDFPLVIIVSANGCSDATAAVATRPGVTVIERAEPGKAEALNAADRIAKGFPRIYLDADILVPPDGVARVTDRLRAADQPLAVVPKRRLNVAGRPWPVRGYFAVNQRLPAFRDGLFGRGMIALSATGRARFDAFPPQIADDLFIDSQFLDGEKAEASDVEVVVETPFTTRDLLRRLIRVRRGNAQLRAAAAAGQLPVRIRPSDRWAWLREVVVREPRLMPAAIPYLGLTVTAAFLARRPAKAGQEWGRDESTRSSVRGAPA